MASGRSSVSRPQVCSKFTRDVCLVVGLLLSQEQLNIAIKGFV